MIKNVLRGAAMLTVVSLVACAIAPASSPPTAKADTASKYVAIPPNKDSDLKLYKSDGSIVSGAAALGSMQQDASVILWLAGNQFFAMDDAQAPRSG